MCTSEKSLDTTRVLPFAGREIVGQVSVECLRFVDVHGDCTVHIMNFWSQKGCLQRGYLILGGSKFWIELVGVKCRICVYYFICAHL